MKKINIVWVLMLMVSLLTFSGYKDRSITKFYYYKGQPFWLTLKNDAVFIKLKKDADTKELNSLLEKYHDISLIEVSDVKDTKFFLSLKSVRAETGITEISNMLKDEELIEYASPVFSPDEDKTLIGVQNEILVQFKPEMPENEIRNIIASKNLTIKKKLDLTGGSSYILTVNESASAIDIANDVYLSGKVNWSEPNLVFTNLLGSVPNDSLYNRQWTINNTGNNIPTGISGVPGCDMNVDNAWTLPFINNEVIIAVSDTGCDTLHEDMEGKFLPGSGYDFYNNRPGARDDNGHGTCCAGVIGAATNNRIGIAGITPNAKIIPVKCLNSQGIGGYSEAAEATIWSYQRGADIISNSWGFIGGASSAIDQAINDCTTLGRGGKGTLFVILAGNENGAMRFPANSHTKVLTVGGISPCNQRKAPSICDFENWGASYGPTLHVVAPCVKIYTTDMRTGGFAPGRYFAEFNGTSSSTPNVAAVCALLLSVDSSQTWDEVRYKIAVTAEKRGSYTYTTGGPLGAGTWNNEMGYGLVNAYKAVKLAIDGLTGIEITSPAMPNTFVLEQNYPNPFNPSTSIKFSIPSKSDVKLSVYNSLGKEIAVVLNQNLNAGLHEVNFNAENLSSGIYYYKLTAINGSNTFIDTKKMMLIK